jgi:uncharacterized protein YcgI (DUF1989 family)
MQAPAFFAGTPLVPSAAFITDRAGFATVVMLSACCEETPTSAAWRFTGACKPRP